MSVGGFGAGHYEVIITPGSLIRFLRPSDSPRKWQEDLMCLFAHFPEQGDEKASRFLVSAGLGLETTSGVVSPKSGRTFQKRPTVLSLGAGLANEQQ